MANNTFATITLETPDATYQYINFKVTSGTTQTCTGFVADGTIAYKIVIGASTTSAGTLSDSSGTNTVTNCTISYSTVSGGATWIASKGCSDAGNNTGWTFIGALSSSIPSMAGTIAWQSVSAGNQEAVDGVFQFVAAELLRLGSQYRTLGGDF